VLKSSGELLVTLDSRIREGKVVRIEDVDLPVDRS
jgi:hypothetical protein